jgi:hypothetical protein
MTAAIKEGFPRLRKDMDRLGEAIDKGGLNGYDYFRAFPDHGGLRLERFRRIITYAPDISPGIDPVLIIGF